MSQQFGRILLLTIGQAGGEARTSPGLRIVARVSYKSARAGEAEIEVYNPAPLTIAAAQTKGAVFRLLGGYDVPELIFEGTAIRDGVMVRKEGPDRILAISARTGGTQLEQARVALSFAGVFLFAYSSSGTSRTTTSIWLILSPGGGFGRPLTQIASLSMSIRRPSLSSRK